MGQEDREWFRERKIDYDNGGLLPPGRKTLLKNFLSGNPSRNPKDTFQSSYLKSLVFFGSSLLFYLLWLILKLVFF